MPRAFDFVLQRPEPTLSNADVLLSILRRSLSSTKIILTMSLRLLIEADVDIVTVKDLARHGRVATTARYENRKREAANKLKLYKRRPRTG